MRKLLKCCRKPLGKSVWVKHILKSGTGDSNVVAHLLTKTPVLADLRRQTTPDSIQRVRFPVEEDRPLSVRDVESDFGIPKTIASCS